MVAARASHSAPVHMKTTRTPGPLPGGAASHVGVVQHPAAPRTASAAVRPMSADPYARLPAPVAGGPLSSAGPPPPGAQRTRDLHFQAVQHAAVGSTGQAFVQTALVDIRQRAARGELVRVVFDLDNTLFDTRARTLAAAKAFDAHNGTRHFAAATLDSMGRDGRATAAAMGLDPDTAAAFGAFWDQAFWSADNLQHDLPIDATVKLARQAKAAGAQVVYLTGRVADLHDASMAQLVAHGLPDADAAHLFCKPDVSVRTAPFKTDLLNSWATQGHVAWFVTEGRRDIHHVQDNAPNIPCLLLDCSMEGSGLPVSPQTPVLPRVF